MQMQELLLMLIMLIVIPMLILTLHHNIFFIIIAIILLIASLRKAHSLLLNRTHGDKAAMDEKLNREFEDSLSIDARKFGIGTKVVKNLIIILFLTYCSFYQNTFTQTLLTSAAVAYWVYDTVNKIKEQKNCEQNTYKVKNIFTLLINLDMVIIIIKTAVIKFII